MDSKLAYFTRTYVRGFVATRPFIPTFMFIIMFTFVVFSRQLTLPFPHSWNIDVNLDRELFGLIPRYIAWPNAAYNRNQNLSSILFHKGLLQSKIPYNVYSCTIIINNYDNIGIWEYNVVYISA